MNQLERIRETIAAYRKHGWQLKRVLMQEETHHACAAASRDIDLEGVVPVMAPMDALWFARPSHGEREAWELRLVGETPYALFEAFEADEDEDAREEVRCEMEARLREYVVAD
jgi:hypothetical protein